jgi:hypothetical protein
MSEPKEVKFYGCQRCDKKIGLTDLPQLVQSSDVKITLGITEAGWIFVWCKPNDPNPIIVCTACLAHVLPKLLWTLQYKPQVLITEEGVRKMLALPPGAKPSSNPPGFLSKILGTGKKDK